MDSKQPRPAPVPVGDRDSGPARGRVLLSVRHLGKTFGQLRALDDVSLEVRSGEVVALLGQNGSGKSTLVKILTEVYSADTGHFEGPASDRAGSIHVLHQDLGLIDSLSTVENLSLADLRPARALRPLRRGAEAADARELLARFGIRLDVTVPVSRLTPAQRTIVAIARALDGWTSPDSVLILDEPTASLHGDEVQTLFDAVRTVAAAGAGVLFISHRLEEVTELANRVVVLRDGALTADVPATGLTSSRLAEMITGTHGAQQKGRPAPSGGTAVLSVHRLSGGSLRHLDLTVAAGEVVGIAGSLGSGREDVAGLVYGAQRRRSGTHSVGESRAAAATPRASRAAGIGYVPADRRAHGAAMTLSLRENLTLPALHELARARVHIAGGAERATVEDWMARVGVRPARAEQPLGLFSGGNQQKVVIARWLRTSPVVLLVEEPTQGVDVGASEAIRELIVATARRGTAVLVSSSDNTDLIRICDRVLVLRDGACVAELVGAEINDHRLTEECLGVSSAPGARPAAVPRRASRV